LNLIRVMPAKGQDHSMDRSRTIARVTGPVLAVIGIGLLANSAAYTQVARQLFTTPPLIYLTGVLLLVCGLGMLNLYHAWTSDWRSTVTVIGWALSAIGVFRLIAPELSAFAANAIVAHQAFLLGAGVVLLALGGFLTFKGYVA
jgi:hypothetical protein